MSTKLLASQLVPNLVPTTGKTSILESILDKVTVEADRKESVEAVGVSAYAVKRKTPLTTSVNGVFNVGGKGLEPSTPSLSSWCSNQLS